MHMKTIRLFAAAGFCLLLSAFSCQKTETAPTNDFDCACGGLTVRKLTGVVATVYNVTDPYFSITIPDSTKSDSVAYFEVCNESIPEKYRNLKAVGVRMRINADIKADCPTMRLAGTYIEVTKIEPLTDKR